MLNRVATLAGRGRGTRSLCTAVVVLICSLAWVAAPAAAVNRVRVGLEAGAQAPRAQIARYWTPARMKSARPLTRAGSAPAPDRQVAGEGLARFTGVLDATLPPYAASGRIFLKMGGYNAYCSGTAINSPSRTLVVTAGHCVLDLLPRHRRPTSARYMDFVPAYADGEAPFGEFTANSGYVLKPWSKRLNENYDMAAVLTSPNAIGQNVADAIGGGETVAVDQPRRQDYQVLGYPGFDQQQMKECDAAFSGNDRRSYRIGGPPSMGIYCSMPAGSSGGPWLIDGGTALAGLTTYGYSRDLHTFSPYFSSGSIGSLVAGY